MYSKNKFSETYFMKNTFFLICIVSLKMHINLTKYHLMKFFVIKQLNIKIKHIKKKLYNCLMQ